MPPPASARTRRTRALVKAEDRVARTVITLGGISVVVAVLGICVYLLLTVLPLFKGGSASPRPGAPIDSGIGSPLAIVMDEDAAAATVLTADGTLRTIRLADGSLIDERPLLESGGPPTAMQPPDPSSTILAAGADRTLTLATLDFASALLSVGSAPPATGVVGARIEDARAVLDPTRTTGGLVRATGAGEYRLIVPIVRRAQIPALDAMPAMPTRLATAESRSGDRYLVALDATGQGIFASSRTITPLGEAPRTQWSSIPLPPLDAVPDWLFVTADAQAILLVHRDGRFVRLAAAGSSVAVAESGRLVPEGTSITAATMLLGGLSVVVGDDAGAVHAFFTAPDPDAGTTDAFRLIEGHNFRVSDAPITALAPASRDRLILAADANGQATLVHMTSQKVVATLAARLDNLAALRPSPRADAIALADAAGRIDLWSVTLGHPKASMHALFGRPVYEGQREGEYVYQSSAGSDRAELKMSLVPLLFGTLKATIFATIFAVPLAVLAAVYTSEFVSPRSRRFIKPTIELMASLPSVVLGFVAAIVVAPLLASILPQALTCMVVVPIVVLLGAQVWQLAPPRVATRVRGMGQVGLVAVAAGIGVLAGAALTPAFQAALFSPSRAEALARAGSVETVAAEDRPTWIGDRRSLSPRETRRLRDQGLYFRSGNVVRPVEPPAERAADVQAIIERNGLDRPDLRAWLNGTYGGPVPGWLGVLFPPAMIIAWIVAHWLTATPFRSLGSNRAVAIAGLLRFGAILLGAALLDAAASFGLAAAGLDPRDSILGPFSVRNSTVVGIIMGFAIIPIIYTIAEDAMRGVPEGLRLASLGAGATPWQTAVRVVLPVAASGIFSACMIGLGRAVGETMIVLMATGNSPEMNWNMFSGFRTLAANIAVELPESDKGSTHYRVLFLCGLLLFALTFLINTTAEIVRQHVRRRNASL